MVDVSVKLSRSYSVHGKTFDTVTLREPTYADTHISGLGRPQEWQGTKDGPVLLTMPVTIDAYAQRLVVEPGYEMIAQLSAIDALRVERAICGFFIEPAPATTGTTSTSGPAS